MFYQALITKLNEDNEVEVVENCGCVHTAKSAAAKCASKLCSNHDKSDHYEVDVIKTIRREASSLRAKVGNVFGSMQQFSAWTASLPAIGHVCDRCRRNGREGYFVQSKIGGNVIECDSCPNPRDSRFDFDWRDVRTMRNAKNVARREVSSKGSVESSSSNEFRKPNERGERHAPKSGHAHPCFSDLVNRIKTGLPTMLVGAAGTGKTFIAEQVAEYLDRPFATISCSGGMSESQLTGRLLPIGEGGLKFEYVPTELVRMVRDGGLFLADEFDAADPNVALVLNQLSANRRLVLPNNPSEPTIKAHEDFVIIFSSNTFGTGADREYVGRNQMDAATLDRTRMGTVVVEYDNGLEKKLVKNAELRKAFQGIRRKAAAARLRRVISMRALINANSLVEECGWNVAECVDQLTLDWTADEKAKAGVTV